MGFAPAWAPGANLEPDEARRQASKAVRILMAADDKERVPPEQWYSFGESLASLAPLLGPEDASAAAGLIVRDLREQKSNALPDWDGQVKTLAAMVPDRRDEAAGDAKLTVELMGETNTSYELKPLPDTLAALLVQTEPAEAGRRVRSLVEVIGNSSSAATSFAGLAPTVQAWQPLSGRLTEQQLVDLLKTPTCRQEGRRSSSPARKPVRSALRRYVEFVD